jgi:hypothetical protein
MNYNGLAKLMSGVLDNLVAYLSRNKEPSPAVIAEAQQMTDDYLKRHFKGSFEEFLSSAQTTHGEMSRHGIGIAASLETQMAFQIMDDTPKYPFPPH